MNSYSNAKVCLCVMTAIIIMLSGCELNSRPPELFLVPAGYVGWLSIGFNIKGAPPLPKRNGYLVCSFDSSGKIRTSSPYWVGMAKDKSYYVSSRGWKQLKDYGKPTTPLIYGSFTTPESTDVLGNGKFRRTVVTPSSLNMFVGNLNQFNHSQQPKEMGYLSPNYE